MLKSIRFLRYARLSCTEVHACPPSLLLRRGGRGEPYFTLNVPNREPRLSRNNRGRQAWNCGLKRFVVSVSSVNSPLQILNSWSIEVLSPASRYVCISKAKPMFIASPFGVLPLFLKSGIYFPNIDT
jgi:hypothetical protein